MGLFDRFAERVAKEINKAPNLPAGSVVMTEADMKNRAGIMYEQYGQTTPLPRNPILPGIPFGPGQPLTPGSINPVGASGRPDPRRYEYQVAQNINITATKLVPFDTLRASADQIDILRRCIEVLKNKMVGLDWDITLADSASEKIISESGGDHVHAMARAREKYTDEIARLRAFWENPDRANGLTFSDWLMLSLEEILVIDAWAVWPQMAINGDLYGLQVLDGSTIKPLLDDRGMRPMAPNPAFQQILYGFPRSEFTVTNENENADGEFSSDELAYMIRNRRTFSVYGYSPVERSLPLADLYLRRQQWLRAEYTDGVLPEIMFETDANFGNNPELLRAYENIFNDDLSGQTAQRVRARFLPSGFHPVQYEGYGERFKDVLDNYLITSITGHFGVLPSEIGFMPASGLGGAVGQGNEAEAAELIGLMPLANWLSKMLSNLSYTYLGMPRELEFKLMPSMRQDTLDNATRDDILTRGGKKTINEARSELGLPLLDTPEADMPILIAGNSVFLMTPEGLTMVDNGMGMGMDGTAPDQQPEQPTTDIPNKPEDQDGESNPLDQEEYPTKSAKRELQTFLKWANKGVRNRPFNFENVEPVVGEALNRCLEDGDIEMARTLIFAYTT
jgi:hypothetical protein